MQRSIIIAVVIALGIGYAAGSIFTPSAFLPAALLKPTTGSTAGSTATSPEPVPASMRPSTTPIAGAPAPTLEKLVGSDADVSYSFGHVKDIITYADSLSADDFPKVLKQLQAMPDTRRKSSAQYFIGMRWSEVDPDGALAWSKTPGQPATTST